MMRWHCPIRLACFGWRTSKTILCQGSSANHSGCKPATPPLQRRGRFPCGRLSALSRPPVRVEFPFHRFGLRLRWTTDTRHSGPCPNSQPYCVYLNFYAHGRIKPPELRLDRVRVPTLAVHPSRVSLFRPLQNCYSKTARGSKHASRPRDTRALTARNSSKTKNMTVSRLSSRACSHRAFGHVATEQSGM